MSRSAEPQYWVYILSNRAGMFYIGVTDDLERRTAEHRERITPGFALKYGLTKLVYFECGGDVQTALAREKQLKGWKRDKKAALIEAMNPEWRDLGADLLGGDGAFGAEAVRLARPLQPDERLVAKLRQANSRAPAKPDGE